MSNRLRDVLNIAKNIQTDVDAAGMGKPQALNAAAYVPVKDAEWEAKIASVNALQAALDALEWAEDPSIEQDACDWYFAKAQAYAAVAQACTAQEQAAQLKRIANVLEAIIDPEPRVMSRTTRQEEDA